MLADYHVHTEFSEDSTYPMADVVEDAIALGLDEICLTDHVDYGIKHDWDEPGPMPWRCGAPLSNVDYPRYLTRIAELRRAYEGRITLRAGLELGVQTHTVGRYEALWERVGPELDFAILSIHQVDDLEFWNQAFQAGRTQQEYNERYYEEMLEVVRAFDHWSVLGHMDLIVRYDEAGPYPFERVRPLVTQILRHVIAAGKGIEVNTSSVRYGLADTTPSRAILALYRELGGRIVTIGSDSHEPGQLGAHIREAHRTLAELGFTEWCTFERMEPTFHPLEV